jgi:hypothetical protein
MITGTEEERTMWAEQILALAEIIFPKRWAEYEEALYDYEGWIDEEDVEDIRGAEMWCKAPGKRRRTVVVIVQDGKRLRVRDKAATELLRPCRSARSAEGQGNIARQQAEPETTAHPDHGETPYRRPTCDQGEEEKA